MFHFTYYYFYKNQDALFQFVFFTVLFNFNVAISFPCFRFSRFYLKRLNNYRNVITEISKAYGIILPLLLLPHVNK